MTSGNDEKIEINRTAMQFSQGRKCVEKKFETFQTISASKG